MSDHTEHGRTRRVVLGTLEASALGPTAQINNARVPIFIGQETDLNGSAAALCTLMALVASGELHGDDVRRLGGLRPEKTYERVWPWIKRDYLVGADTSELRHLVSRLTNRFRSTFTDAKNARAARWILRELHRDRWVVVGLESARPTLEHWCLIVGYETPELLRRLFLLDPALEMPVTACWNASYELPSNASGLFFERSQKRYTARLSGAVALFPANRPARHERGRGAPHG